jgi:ATP-dependent DNA helicase RecG
VQVPNKESDKVEFKPGLSNAVIVALVAFSNAKGGTVYIGVANNAKVIGVSLGQETLPQFLNEIKNKTSPSIIPDSEIIDVGKNKKVVVLSVLEYPIKPVSFQGKYYKRVNASNHPLSADEVANMHLQTINTSWDMYPDPIHSLDDISLDKVQKTMEILKSKGITVDESAPSFLSKYSFLRDGKPTIAAYLMFKNNDCVLTTIELGRFQDPVTIKDTARSKSDVLAQVDEVLNYVKKHINLEVIITGNAQNTQKWQYPMEAIREIVLNMIIHRDYRSSYDSIVKIFNDKIEFYNPGSLPDTISIEDLMSNNYGSKPRNKRIAEVFKDMGLIEKYGSGIKRIIGYFREANLPTPKFENSADGFMVTVFCIDGIETVEETVGTVEKTVGTVEETVGTVEETVEETVGTVEKIFDIIVKYPQITQQKLMEITGLTRRGVEWNLSKLKAKGLIERIGPNKGGYWRVK